MGVRLGRREERGKRVGEQMASKDHHHSLNPVFYMDENPNSNGWKVGGG